MKYLCLIYFDEDRIAAMPAQELNSIASECSRYSDALKQSGQLIACERLTSVDTATTVRRNGNGVSITDGPFAETKEQLGGFFLIEAKDRDEAIHIASKIPPGRLGCIEVRAVGRYKEELECPADPVVHRSGVGTDSKDLGDD